MKKISFNKYEGGSQQQAGNKQEKEMPTITIQMLNEMSSGARACKPAREWFQEKFPDGGELFEVWNACRAWRWKVWFAAHSATADVVIEFARSCAKRAAKYAADATAANPAEATAADYAAAAIDYARDAAAATDYAAAYAAAATDYAAAYAAAAIDYARDAAAATDYAAAADYACAAAAATDYAAAAADYACDAAADYAVAPAPTAYYDAEIRAQLAWARGILF